MGLDFLVPIFGIMIVLVPVTGLTVVLTAKFATKPIVEALTQLRSGQGYGTPGDLQLQIQDLAEQVEVLTSELHGIKDAQAFDQKLLQERAAQKGA
jgi:hypothetical protein